MPTKDPAVYLLAGTEEYLKEKELSRIKSAFLDRESEKFNFNIFYAGVTPLEQALECARTAPFIAGKRVVLIRRLEDISTAEERLILSYVKSPQKQTLLVLETAQTNLGQNFFAQLRKYSRVIFCEPLGETQLSDWLKGQLKEKGKKIEEKALRLLLCNLDNSLYALASYLENLILYIGERETIGQEDVEKLVRPDVTAGVFKLYDAVCAKDREKALGILDSLLKEGVNSSQIIGALAHKIISQRDKEKYLFQLQKADSDIKTGRQNQRTALELLLVRLLDLV